MAGVKMKIDIRQYGGLTLSIITLITGIWLLINLYEPVNLQNHSLQHMKFQNVGNVYSKTIKGELKTSTQESINALGDQDTAIDGKQHKIFDADFIEARVIKGKLGYSLQPYITSVGPLLSSINMNNNHVEHIKHVECTTCDSHVVTGEQTLVTSIGSWDDTCYLNEQLIIDIKNVRALYLEALSLDDTFQNSINYIDNLTDDISLGQQSIEKVSDILFTESTIWESKNPVEKDTIQQEGTYNIIVSVNVDIVPTTVNLHIGNENIPISTINIQGYHTLSHQQFIYDTCSIHVSASNPITVKLKAYRLF